MARIPYPSTSHYEREALTQRIKHERGGQLLNLYKMLLHSPQLAEGWLAFLTSVRQQSDLPGRYRELAILRVAVLNGANYEFDVHVPFALREGIEQEVIDALRANGELNELDATARAVIAYTDSMTRDIQVPDSVFEEVRTHFTARHTVELTVTIAAYNCVSRFIEALRVDGE